MGGENQTGGHVCALHHEVLGHLREKIEAIQQNDADQWRAINALRRSTYIAVGVGLTVSAVVTPVVTAIVVHSMLKMMGAQ